MAYRLYVKGSTTLVGELTNDQFGKLVELLEEEHSTDRDYYVDADVLEYLEDGGVDPALIDMLRPHLGAEEGVEIEWREA